VLGYADRASCGTLNRLTRHSPASTLVQPKGFPKKMRLVFACFCLLLLVSVFYKIKTVVPIASAANGADIVAVNSSANRLLIPSSVECHTGKTSTTVNYWRWASNAQVKIYFLNGNFNEAEIAAMTQAVNNWNNALHEINSEVRFEIAGLTDKIVTSRHTITVRRVDKFEGKRLAEIQPYVMSNNNLLSRAEINVGPTIKDLKALTSMMNHELGHSLGLSDCLGCQRGSTAMARFRGKNKDNKLFSPSRCDKYVVAASYFINNYETTSALLNQFK
jgi:hypothetical protein